MKPIILAFIIASQMTAATAFAQTTDAQTDTSGSAIGTGLFGGDWSKTLGSAMFSDDGTAVRDSTEITTQWATMSDDDKAMLRRDCAAYMQTDIGAAADTSTENTATADQNSVASTAADGSAEMGTTPPMNVTTAQMKEICAATKGL